MCRVLGCTNTALCYSCQLAATDYLLSPAFSGLKFTVEWNKLLEFRFLICCRSSVDFARYVIEFNSNCFSFDTIRMNSDQESRGAVNEAKHSVQQTESAIERRRRRLAQPVNDDRSVSSRDNAVSNR